MNRHRTVLSAAAIVVAVGMAGCSHHHEAAAPAPVTPSSTTVPSAPVAPGAELPDPQALADVLYRLSDPAVPGTEKLSLLEGAKPTDAETLDRFTKALKDAGNLPLTVDATDIAWSEPDPGAVVANVTVNTADGGTGGFALPMEFRPTGDGGWQLARKTAEMLLAFGASHTADTPAPPPAPTPTP